jgi:integrase
MARTLRDQRLQTRTAREALRPSGKPYYRMIEAGLHLGYRKGQRGGKWVTRRYLGEQSYAVEVIGTADDTLDADGEIILNFTQAQKRAHQRFVEQERAAVGLPAQQAGPYTVRDAIGDYFARQEQAGKPVQDARWQSDAWILPALGGIACGALTTKQLQTWLSALPKQAARLRSAKGEQRYRQLATDKEAVRRRQATANRVFTVLRSALNFAWRSGKVPTDAAWRPVKPFEGANVARVRYFTFAEAKRLINAAAPDFRDLVRAALVTGCRYGELAAFTVDDFNPDSGTLHVRASKSGKPRHVVLSDEGIAFFRGLTVGREPRELLLVRADGTPWRRAYQNRPMRLACERAKIEGASFHTLRHTAASLAIMNGAPLLVIARNLGHSDTKMVEKHYGHLAADYITDEIRRTAPRFGIADAGNVVPIGGTA